MVTLPAGLLDASELALYEAQIRARLEDEQRGRERFRKELSPDVKAEFINGEVIVDSPANLRLKLNTGTLASRVVKGFESPVRALFDAEENLAALKRLLA